MLATVEGRLCQKACVMKSLMVVTAVGAFAGLTAFSAQALPAANPQAAIPQLAQEKLVTPVARRGGGGSGMRGPGMRGPRAGGGPRFRGPRAGGGPRFRGPRAGGRPPRAGRPHRPHRHYVGPRFRGGYGYGYYGALPYGAYAFSDGPFECNWLRRQAIVSGNPYWWHRYELCLDDY